VNGTMPTNGDEQRRRMKNDANGLITLLAYWGTAPGWRAPLCRQLHGCM